MNNPKSKIKQKVKKHIPKDWLCELRILYRMSMETFHDIRRTGLVNLVIITTMAAILTIFGAFFRTALSASAFAHELGNVLEISVYLKHGTDTNAAKKRILLKLFKRAVPHHSVHAAYSFKIRIVKDHRNQVRGKLYIQLDPVSCVNSFSERRHGVLRRVGSVVMKSPVGEILLIKRRRIRSVCHSGHHRQKI